MSNLCYATIQRKILPQLAGLMALEKQGSLGETQVAIKIPFAESTIEDAVQEIAEAHGWEYYGRSLYIESFKVTFQPK